MDARAPIVRAATKGDLPAIAALAASLVHDHHALDAERFFFVPDVEQRYRDWFGRELGRSEVILLVAEGEESAVEGYCYGRIEGRNWNMLLDRHAALHDVYVAAHARGRGVGAALVGAFCEQARAQRAPRVVLYTATGNHRAHALFEKLGFRRTMIEMTKELGTDTVEAP